jgi:hypothetical protein
MDTRSYAPTQVTIPSNASPCPFCVWGGPTFLSAERHDAQVTDLGIANRALPVTALALLHPSGFNCAIIEDQAVDDDPIAHHKER